MAASIDRGPYLLRPGEGAATWSLGGLFTPKVAGSVSEGRFSLVEATAWRSTEPPLHVHHREDEAWYVLDGRMTFFVGDLELEATTGAFVYAPAGLAHTFTVDLEPTRVLVLASPAGFERFAFELGEPASPDVLREGGSTLPPAGLAMPSPARLDEVAARYGIEIVGPPRRLRE